MEECTLTQRFLPRVKIDHRYLYISFCFPIQLSIRFLRVDEEMNEQFRIKQVT